MSKNSYELRILFDVDSDEKILYDGKSYLKEDLIDYLVISTKSIKLKFSRTDKIIEEEFLYTKKSWFRYQIQKALCFYLVTQGEIPKLKDIELYDGNNTILIKHSHFSETWKNCKIDICLETKNTEVIFSDKEYAKDVYIMITYFLKAQLDMFSNDCFRFAWSGINSVYRLLGKENDREQDKLKCLEKEIERLNMDNSVKYMKEIEESFYKCLDWKKFVKHNMVNKKDFLKYYINVNRYRDSFLLEIFIEMFGIVFKEKNADSYLSKLSESENGIRNFLNEKKDSVQARLKFLICDYCYMIRNRAFHGAKEYPVFVIAEEVETGVERELTKILLLTMKDFIESDKFMD